DDLQVVLNPVNHAVDDVAHFLETLLVPIPTPLAAQIGNIDIHAGDCFARGVAAVATYGDVADPKLFFTANETVVAGYPLFTGRQLVPRGTEEIPVFRMNVVHPQRGIRLELAGLKAEHLASATVDNHSRVLAIPDHHSARYGVENARRRVRIRPNSRSVETRR